MAVGELLAGVMSTFGLGFFYFIASIPAGMALGLPGWVAAVTAWLSYTLGVVLVVAVGAPVRAWLARRFKLADEPDPDKLIWRIWKRYGLAGLALLAPVTVGSQIGALLGVSMGVKPRALLVGMSLGVAVWCAGIALAVTLGVQVVQG
ncbi:MAG: hypothetical protein J0L63_17900 [Anaerolineae bacterium]|nr:hypothetical protein [Anaerolineae bacterium]MBN8620792.1 hypothetical protein [Anaerolineae bacterium]